MPISEPSALPSSASENAFPSSKKTPYSLATLKLAKQLVEILGPNAGLDPDLIAQAKALPKQVIQNDWFGSQKKPGSSVEAFDGEDDFSLEGGSASPIENLDEVAEYILKYPEVRDALKESMPSSKRATGRVVEPILTQMGIYSAAILTSWFTDKDSSAIKEPSSGVNP